MKLKMELKFDGSPLLAKRLIFIDGITRSGKFWLANLLNHLESVEHFRMDPCMDYISVAFSFGLIEESAAIGMLRDIVNRHVYETVIGRNINFRIADSSSVYNNPNLPEYMRRVYGTNVNPIDTVEELKKGSRYFVFITHDWLSYLSLQLKVFPEMKLIRIERDPIDLVYAWYTKGLGEERMLFGCRIEGINGSVPWFAHDWLSDFENMTEMDRIIRSVIFLNDSSRLRFQSLQDDQRLKIRFTTYEMLAAQPADEARMIAEFLQTRVSDSMWTFVSKHVFRERTANKLYEARKEKLELIKKHASAEMFSLIKKVSEEYKELQKEGGVA